MGLRVLHRRRTGSGADGAQNPGADRADVSVERAKLARERLAMEEQLQRWETEKQRLEDSNESVSQGKKHTGRWLSRLGLSKDEH